MSALAAALRALPRAPAAAGRLTTKANQRQTCVCTLRETAPSMKERVKLVSTASSSDGMFVKSKLSTLQMKELSIDANRRKGLSFLSIGRRAPAMVME